MADQNRIGDKRILLLGAGTDQLFIIRIARQMGFKTIVVDINPNAPGFAEADEHAVISTYDVEAIKAYIDKYRTGGKNIDGVAVMGSDIPQVVCTLAEHLGAPHIPLEAAELSIDKYLMKKRFQQFSVPVPWFSLVESPSHLRSIIAERGLPLIIKPVDRSGARGVFYLTAGCDLDSLFSESQALSFSGRVMAEEFLSGLQISTESVIYNGRAYTPGFADRNYELLERYRPNIIENGGWVPSILSAEDREAVEKLVEKAALALGVEEGVVKGDVVYTNEGPKMIEMATRLSGGDFSESLIPLGCGVNLVEAALKIAVGLEPDLDKLRPGFNKGVVNRYFFPSPGRLLRIRGEEEVRKLPWVKKLEFWYNPGDMVPEVKSHADRFGVFIVTGETRQEAEQRAEQVYNSIEIDVEPLKSTGE